MAGTVGSTQAPQSAVQLCRHSGRPCRRRAEEGEDFFFSFKVTAFCFYFVIYYIFSVFFDSFLPFFYPFLLVCWMFLLVFSGSYGFSMAITPQNCSGSVLV